MKFNSLKLNEVSYSNTQLKQDDQQIKTEYGNLSTSRAKGAVIKQFMTEDNDTGRLSNNEKEQFKKMQNLEFQNGLFQMQMYIQQRYVGNTFINEKTLKINRYDKNQPKSNRIYSIFRTRCNQQKMPVLRPKFVNILTVKHLLVVILAQLKVFKLIHKSIDMLELSQDSILNNFKELFETCNANEKLTTLAKQYCGTLQTVEIDLMQQHYSQIIESLIKMIIDIVKKFNSIKLDRLRYEQGTPDKQQYNFEFGTFNKEQRKTLLTNESPAFQSNDELEEMRLKLSDHYDNMEIKKINKQAINIVEPQRKAATSHIHEKNKNSDLIPSLRGKAKIKQQLNA